MKLDKHLTPLKRSSRISVWNDKEIEGGDNWDEAIKEELRNADMILLLVSSDFISSNYIWETELKSALDRSKKGLSKVIPIFLRECVIKDMPFAGLQGYIDPKKPVTSFSEREEDWVFTTIVTGISNDIDKWVKRENSSVAD